MHTKRTKNKAISQSTLAKVLEVLHSVIKRCHGKFNQFTGQRHKKIADLKHYFPQGINLSLAEAFVYSLWLHPLFTVYSAISLVLTE